MDFEPIKNTLEEAPDTLSEKYSDYDKEKLLLDELIQKQLQIQAQINKEISDRIIAVGRQLEEIADDLYSLKKRTTKYDFLPHHFTCNSEGKK